MDYDKLAYTRKLEAHLDEWQAEIERLAARTRRSKATARIEFGQQVEVLNDRFETVWRELRAAKRHRLT